jgi:DNA-binding transcriptional MerR regulator
MDRSELPEKLYYSISEVAEHFDVSQSLLRYWETEFQGIHPKRNKKGTRFYTNKDLKQIELIYHLVKEKGYTLSGAKDQLRTSRLGLNKQIQALKILREVKGFLHDIHKKL